MAPRHLDQAVAEDVCQVVEVWFFAGDFGMDQWSLQRYCLELRQKDRWGIEKFEPVGLQHIAKRS